MLLRIKYILKSQIRNQSNHMGVCGGTETQYKEEEKFITL